MSIVLILILLLPNSSNAFFSGSKLPKDVKNECEFKVDEYGPRGRALGLIELKDSNGEISERAFIFFECTRKASGLPPKKVGGKFLLPLEPVCSGVRINGLNKDRLEASSIYNIYPHKVSIQPSTSSSELIWIWEEASEFKYDQNAKTFSWKMTSKLSGEKHFGLITCSGK